MLWAFLVRLTPLKDVTASQQRTFSDLHPTVVYHGERNEGFVFVSCLLLFCVCVSMCVCAHVHVCVRVCMCE